MGFQWLGSVPQAGHSDGSNIRLCRYGRARYDADLIVAVFAEYALQPEHLSLWTGKP
jgi:hypothetical protein